MIDRENSGTIVGMETFWKFATAGDVTAGDADFGLSENQKASGGTIAYTDVNATTPIDDSGSNVGPPPGP